MKLYIALALVSGAAAFQPSVIGRFARTQVRNSAWSDAEAAIAEAKAASAKYGPSSPEAALAWEGTSLFQNSLFCRSIGVSPFGRHFRCISQIQCTQTFKIAIRQPLKKLTAETIRPPMKSTEQKSCRMQNCSRQLLSSKPMLMW